MPDDDTPNLVLGDLLWRWAEYDAMSDIERWWIDDHRFLSVPETRELLQRAIVSYDARDGDTS